MASLALEVTLDHDITESKSGLTVSEIETELSSSSTSSQAPDHANASISEDDWVYPHPTDFKLKETPIDEVRELKVCVIGAGVSGRGSGP
jgi:hypothetical protein